MTTILIIEDDASIRHNIAEILTYEGYQTLEAENGRAGVEAALNHQPDLIICDVMMPELDGFEVVRQLQAEATTATIPFIFLTARSDRKSIREGMQLGADDYLTKPFTPDELIATIQARLAKHHAALEHFKQLSAASAERQPPDQPLTAPQSSADLTSTLPSPPRKANTLSLLQIGSTLRGYQILEKIGEGGAGAVYKAYQSNLGRVVAIKVLRQKYAGNKEFIHRFRTEAELVARLEHPHIIPLYDYWHDQNGIYIVMRWLRGGSLRVILAQQNQQSLQEIARLLDQVTDALAVAHGVGIVHRDLKPDNILLDEHGNAYLTDFGLAKNVLSGAVDPALRQDLDALIQAQREFFRQQPQSTLYITEGDNLTGTPAYLSPEQIRFETLSPQTDIYSLGIMLYELVTGQLPFFGDLGDVFASHLFEAVPSARALRPDVPAAVDAVIQKAAAKLQEERYADVLALAADFRRACGL